MLQTKKKSQFCTRLSDPSILTREVEFKMDLIPWIVTSVVMTASIVAVLTILKSKKYEASKDKACKFSKPSIPPLPT